MTSIPSHAEAVESKGPAQVGRLKSCVESCQLCGTEAGGCCLRHSRTDCTMDYNPCNLRVAAKRSRGGVAPAPIILSRYSY